MRQSSWKMKMKYFVIPPSHPSPLLALWAQWRPWDPSKWELGLFWSSPPKHLQEDEAKADLQQLLCPCKEWQRAHKNHARSTDAFWAQAYKRSTAISSVCHCCCSSQQQLCSLSFSLKHRSFCIIYSITIRMAWSFQPGTLGRKKLFSRHSSHCGGSQGLPFFAQM